MNTNGFRALDSTVVYDGWIMTVAKREFEAPDGSRFERDVITHPGAVAVVPLIDDDIVLVRQYRPALDDFLLELPAGIRDVDGEPPEVTANRELVEEVGMRAERLDHLTTIHNAAGYCDEQIFIFIGRELTQVDRELTNSPEEVEMEIVRLPLSEAREMVSSGQITDAKTIIGILASVGN